MRTSKRLSAGKGGSRRISLHPLPFLKTVTLKTVPKLAQCPGAAIDRVGSFQAALVRGWLQRMSTPVEESSTPWCVQELQLSSCEVCRRTAAVLRDNATGDAMEMSHLVWLRECEGPDTMPDLGALSEWR